MHPKEAFISHGILNPEIARMKDAASLSRRGGGSATIKPGSGGSSTGGGSGSASGGRGGLTFVYPYGATMTVQSPAHPVLSSGPISYPLNRPVAGVWECPPDVLPGGKSGEG
ncbi:unnamed protein product, partial [Laminaria digitata]